MIEIFQRMLAGDTQIVGRFVRCKEFWEKFFREHERDSHGKLATALGDDQALIEDIFDQNRAEAKEAMPITCFGSLYDEHGWDDSKRRLAQRLAKAFQDSSVSLEVKDYAEEAAKIFHVFPG